MKRLNIKRIISAVLLSAMVFSVASPAGIRGSDTVHATGEVSLALPDNWYNVASRLQTVSVTVPDGQEIGLISSTYDSSGKLRESVFQTVDATGDVQVQFTKNAFDFNVMAVDKNTLAPVCDNIRRTREITDDDFEVRNEEIELPLLEDGVARATGAALHDYLEYNSCLELMKNMLKLDENGDPVRDANGNPQLAEDFDFDKLSKLVSDTRAACDQATQSIAVLDYAAGKQAEKEQARFNMMAQTDIFDLTDAEKLSWAEQFTKRFDAIEGNMKIQTLAKQMGMDAHEVKDMLDASQAILQSKYTSDAEKALLMEKICIGIKATSKVALFVGGTVLTGGATGMVTVAEATGILVGGVDTALEVAESGSKIVYGPDNANIDKVFNNTGMKTVKGVLFVYNLVSGGIGYSGNKDFEKIAYIGDLREKAMETLNSFGIEDQEGKLVAKLIELGYDGTEQYLDPSKVPGNLMELLRNNSIGKLIIDDQGRPVTEDWQKIKEELEKDGNDPDDDKLKSIIDEEKDDNSDDNLEDITEDFEEKVKKEEEPGGGEPGGGGGEPGGGDPPPKPRTVIDPATIWDQFGRGGYSKYTLNSEGEKTGLEEDYLLVKKIDDEHGIWRKERERYHSDDKTQGKEGVLWEKDYGYDAETGEIYLLDEFYYSGQSGPGMITIRNSYFPDGQLKHTFTTRETETYGKPDLLEDIEYHYETRKLYAHFDSASLMGTYYDEETGEKLSEVLYTDCSADKKPRWNKKYWPGLTFKAYGGAYSWTETEQHLSEYIEYDGNRNVTIRKTYTPGRWEENSVFVYGWIINTYDNDETEISNTEYEKKGNC